MRNAQTVVQSNHSDHNGCTACKKLSTLRAGNIMNSFASGNARLSRQDLIRNARDVSGYRLHTEHDRSTRQRPPNRPKGMIEGWIMTEHLQPGMSFHVINGHALQDFSIEAQIKPCLKISLILEGDTHISFGEKGYKLEAKPRTANLLKLTEHERCHLQSVEGVHREAINITLEPEWFEWAGVSTTKSDAMLTEHLSTLSMTLPEHLWLQAKYLAHQQESSRAGQLAREGFVLSLMSHWLSHHTSARPPRRDRPESRRAQQFVELMSSNEVLDWSLTQVGDHLGMSHATLQRYARECLGVSLTQYLREQRLRKACVALKRDGITILEASMMAGYSHPGNFTAAFKRYFGVCPTDVYRHGLDRLLAHGVG
jgi:AraC-like DNA-binding protein